MQSIWVLNNILVSWVSFLPLQILMLCVVYSCNLKSIYAVNLYQRLLPVTKSWKRCLCLIFASIQSEYPQHALYDLFTSEEVSTLRIACVKSSIEIAALLYVWQSAAIFDWIGLVIHDLSTNGVFVIVKNFTINSWIRSFVFYITIREGKNINPSVRGSHPLILSILLWRYCLRLPARRTTT